MTAAAIVPAPMRAALVHVSVLAPLLLALALPARAQDAGVAAAGDAPARPATLPRAQVAPTPDDALATPPAAPVPDGAARPPGAESAEQRESREERERWRIPSDLVNPFVDDSRYEGHGHRRERDADAGSWFIAEEDLVDPWRSGRLGPFYGVRCSGRWCRADPASAVYIAPPAGNERRGRRRGTRRVELAAIIAASTVSDDARARLEVQATVHRGAFGVGLSLSTSTGEIRVGALDVTHPRHAIAVVVEHRFTDGTVMFDLGVAAGLMLTELRDAALAPLARVMATAGLSISRNVELLVRGDALTTFLRPGATSSGGPSAFEFSMGVGLRIATN